MESVEKLKPCPFCGGKARIEHGLVTWAVVCPCSSHVFYGCEKDKAKTAEAWNTRAATTIGMVQVEVEPTKRTCKLEPLEAFYVTVNMLDQTELGVCSNCGTASPIDATYCCECGRRVER